VLRRPQGCLEPIGNFYFVIDVVKMRFYRISTDVQIFGDLAVVDSGSDQNQVKK